MEAVDRGKQLLVMTIEIGDGRQDFIAVHENDDPAFLAQEFGLKYGLKKNLQKNLMLMIQENTKEVLKNELHLKAPSESESFSQSPYFSPIKTENAQSQSRLIKMPKQETQESPSKGSIYGAVYKQLRKSVNSKSMSSVTSQNKSKKSGTYNYGDYLYAKGIQNKEKSEKNKELMKQEIFQKDIQELTFSPLINTNSSLISPRVYDRPENILLKKKQEKDEKIKKLKEELDQEYYKECYFSPKINQNSKSRDTGTSIYRELYTQAEKLREKREKKIEEELQQIPFKPDVKTAKKKNVFETKDQLFDRLESSKKVSEEEIEKMRREKEQAELNNCRSYKELKSPKTDESDKYTARYNSAPIWEYLYSERDKKKNEIQSFQEQNLKTIEETSTIKKTTEKSDKIFNDFKNKQYEKLFTLMDIDKDGKISAQSIDISKIEIPVLKLLKNFIEELDKTQVSLTLSDFCCTMDNIYKSLNVEEKAILIKRFDKKEEDEEERRPYLSLNSEMLAVKKRSKLPSDFYDRQNAVTKMTEMKLQKIREENQEFEVKDCTFKPALKSN